MAKRKSYGRSRSGVELTDATLARMVEEAEAGLDVTKLRPRRAPAPPPFDPDLDLIGDMHRGEREQPETRQPPSSGGRR